MVVDSGRGSDFFTFLLRESSLDESIANATSFDVFAEYLKSEDCAVYKKNQSGVKRVLSWFEKTPDSQIKGQSQLQKYW